MIVLVGASHATSAPKFSAIFHALLVIAQMCNKSVTYNLYYRNMLDMSATELDDVTAAYNSSLYWYHLSEEKIRAGKYKVHAVSHSI